jgi:hypothetical protein
VRIPARLRIVSSAKIDATTSATPSQLRPAQSLTQDRDGKRTPSTGSRFEIIAARVAPIAAILALAFLATVMTVAVILLNAEALAGRRRCRSAST